MRSSDSETKNRQRAKQRPEAQLVLDFLSDSTAVTGEYNAGSDVSLFHGDCIELLASIPDGAADLVVTMERRHARELAVAIEGASSRVHTLGALVAWLGSTEDLSGSPADRVARFSRERDPSDLLGSGPAEVEDPHGRSKRVHRKAADRIEALAVGMLDGLYPPIDIG